MGIKSIALVVSSLVLSTSANAVVVFDNGASIDPNNTTWNVSSPTFTIYDDFQLFEDTTITDINYSIFTSSITDYNETYISIVNSVGGTTILSPIAVTGSILSNGLVSYNDNVPNGFDISLNDLDIGLLSGTYYLGLSVSNNDIASIASGDSGFGSGMIHKISSTTLPEYNAHMAFSIEGTVSTVPIPSAVWLFGSGLIGLVGLARRKKA